MLWWDGPANNEETGGLPSSIARSLLNGGKVILIRNVIDMTP